MRTDMQTAPEKLSFQDFMEAFRAQYRYGVPGLKKMNISEQVIHKNNRNLHGIILRLPGTRIAPVFYYEDFYDAYVHGSSIEECIRRMAAFVRDNPIPDDCLGDVFSSWENVRERLILKLINYKKNREQLSHIPHRIYGDMAVVTQVYLDDPKIGKGAVMVDESLIDVWSVDKEKVFDAAYENMRRYRIRSFNLLDYDLEDRPDEKDAPNIYVVSYDAPFPGAAALLRTEYLTDFARKKNTDFYVLPVSVHEFLLIEKREGMEDGLLVDMLHSINSDRNLCGNMLSEEVFFLQRDKNCISYLTDGRELCVVK